MKSWLRFRKSEAGVLEPDKSMTEIDWRDKRNAAVKEGDVPFVFFKSLSRPARPGDPKDETRKTGRFTYPVDKLCYLDHDDALMWHAKSYGIVMGQATDYFTMEEMSRVRREATDQVVRMDKVNFPKSYNPNLH